MATQLVAAKRYDPQWTEREYTRGGSRDDLGIETLSEAILADLAHGCDVSAAISTCGWRRRQGERSCTSMHCDRLSHGSVTRCSPRHVRPNATAPRLCTGCSCTRMEREPAPSNVAIRNRWTRT